MQILNNIQKIRWEQNISLRQLSKLSGVSHTEIDMIENGKRNNTGQITMMKISRGLKLSVNEVFHLDYENIDLDNI